MDQTYIDLLIIDVSERLVLVWYIEKFLLHCAYKWGFILHMMGYEKIFNMPDTRLIMCWQNVF